MLDLKQLKEIDALSRQNDEHQPALRRRTEEGLPVGLQVIGAAFQDWKLLAIAAFVESVTRFDTTPTVLRSALVLT